MATFVFLVLALICLQAHALPQTQPEIRNTIFGDEKLEGGIFEHVDEFTEIEMYNDEVNPYRLPTTTRPYHYNVHWMVDLSRRTFDGTVDINLRATQTGVTEIVIHVRELTINNVVLREGNTEINLTYILQAEYDFMRVQLLDGANLAYNANNPVNYTLSIEFGAPLRTDMYGLYESWFRNNYTDEVSWMATTQFQSTAGRSAFPCYDEPSFKSTFDITITRPSTHRSWSCTRIRETINNTVTGYDRDVYYTTPIMSTYLIAVIVAEYDSIEYIQDNLLMYEVIARPSAIDAGQGQYAFDVGMELLGNMSEHTALDFYSVNENIKMTQASIPDFGAGAMENWGLLTYREAYLMYDSNHTSGYYKQLIAYILSHEIAHMWFGNLVTCEWWDVLWLNEGFARYYQYFLTHWVEDYMGLDTRFIIEQMHTALLSDSANNPHPLSNPGVGSPSSVSAMFSTISYNKGAAIIRMTEHLLGSDIHRQGLRNYLVEKAFDIAEPIDLFRNLQSVANATGAISEYGADFSVIDYYASWTEQPGHPVLNVQIDRPNGRMTISQRRFNINTGYSNVNNLYIVPITFSRASDPDFNNTKPTHILRDAVMDINVDLTGDEWVIFNKQQTGFYRVNYDDYSWNLIVLALRGPNRTLIDEYNRAQIVNDVFQFARSGLMSYDRALSILSFLENETDYAPWVAAMVGFNWIRGRYAGTPFLTRIEGLIADWATTVMRDLSYDASTDESFMRSYLRWQLAPVLCSINVRECRQAAVDQFNNLRDNEVEVHVDNRNWVYCNALREDTDGSVYTYLWERFLQHNVYTEKIQLLSVLGCTPYANHLNSFVNNTLSDTYIIRRQDYTTAFNSAVTGNENNTQIVFEYIRNNLQAVIDGFGTATTPLSYISSRLRTEAEITEFQTWATENQAILGNQYQAVLNGAESSRESIRWAASVQNQFDEYFATGDPTIVTTQAPTEPPVQEVTVPQPDLIEPAVPDLPDSAATSIVSVFALVFSVVARFVF